MVQCFSEITFKDPANLQHSLEQVRKCGEGTSCLMGGYFLFDGTVLPTLEICFIFVPLLFHAIFV